ncbi:MAG: OmpA family protein [Oleibacter sp.]|nr:OmpA family protein [Thalassolituus sp.]
MKRTTLAAAIAATMMAASAQAADYKYYGTIGAFFNDTDVAKGYFDDSIEHSYTMEASLGAMLSESWSAEFSVAQPAPFNDDEDADIEEYRLDALYFIGSAALKPYLTAGIGYQNFEYLGFEEDGFLADLGLGLQADFSDRLFARAEVRLDDMTENRLEQTMYGIELGFRFGEVAAAPVVMPKPAPAPAPVVAPKPAPKPVVLDTDKDGVIDSADKCANTPAAASVDADGCPEFSGSLSGVQFESGSARLTDGSRAVLDAAATTLKLYPELDIQIQAYTDNTGSDSFNLLLSEKRAQSVRSYLLGKGVAADKLTAKGFGEANPIASNDTVAGRAENRRVELVVMK